MEKTPDFVGGKVEVKTFDNGGKMIKLWIPMDELRRIKKDSGINVDIKFSRKTGKPYMENNTWQPEKQFDMPVANNHMTEQEFIAQDDDEVRIEDITF